MFREGRFKLFGFNNLQDFWCGITTDKAQLSYVKIAIFLS